MDQRTTSLAAGVVAVALVGGVAVISRGRRPPPIKPVVVYQRGVSAKPPVIDTIEVQFLPPENRPKIDPDDDEYPIEYRVVDRKGRTYASTVTSERKPLLLQVPRTYGKPLDRPRLVALIDGEPPAFADLAPFPPPLLRSLRAQRDSRVRAYHDIQDVSQQTFGRESQINRASFKDAVVVFRLAAPLPKDECWDIQVLGTDIALGGATGREGYRIVPGTSEFVFGPSYAADIQAAQVRVAHLRRKIVSEDVVIRGLRLKKKSDVVVFDLQKPVSVANHLGVRLTLEPEVEDAWNTSELAEYHRYRPSLNFKPDDEVQIDPQLFGFGNLPWGVAGESKPKLFVKLLGPTPLELGLDDILPLTSSPFIRPPKEPARGRLLPKGPIDLRLRLSKTSLEKIDTFEATIPVADAPSTKPDPKS